MLIYLALIESDEDSSKFEVIYKTYKNLMLHIANQILGDTHESEDAVHQAFLKIAEIIKKIDDPRRPKTRALVVTIVERKAIDIYRRRKRRPTSSLDEEITASDGYIEAAETRSILSRAMAMLPTKYRELLLLKYDSGFSEAEIARMLSMSRENVKKTIQRAKSKLSDILKEQEG